MSMDNAPSREKISLQSADLGAERLARLRELFPECWAEGQIDFDKLRSALGEAVAGGPERFTFSWAGRSDAAALLQAPSRATLVPKPNESVNWDTTRNLFVEGDNLEVLKLLYKAYAGKVKLIYIDPPYNTGQDFVYPDDFADPLAVYLKLTGQADEAGKLLTSNPETSGRYHSAWLSMIYPRLFLARQLLRDDGVIFISIDDHEVHHLRTLMNEVFGEENFVAQFVWKSRQYTDARATTGVSTDHEYILSYARNEEFRLRGAERDETKFSNPDDDPRGDWMSRSMLGLADPKQRPNLHYSIIDPNTGNMFEPPEKTGWRYAKDRMESLIRDGCILFPPDPSGRPREKKFRKDMTSEYVGFSSVIQDVFTAHGTAEIRQLFGSQLMEFPKPSRLLKTIVEQSSDPDGIILDFFAGSATTAQAVLELNRHDGGNRQFILVQLPEPTANPQFPTISALGMERIRRVIGTLKKEPGNLTRTTPEDLGFKVFTLDESRFEQWAGVPDRDPAKYADTMGLFVDLIKPGADPTSVLWEIAIKEGYGLNSSIAPATVGLNTIYTVTDPEKEPPQSFRACLDTELASDITKQLGLTDTDLFICRDSALDDTLTANLALQCRLKTL